MIVDDVAPLELNNCRLAYLEISMLTAALIPYTVLNITQSILVSLLVYLLIPLLLLPYIYIFYIADGKRGEFIFKKENSYLLLITSLLTFVTFFFLTFLFIDQTSSKVIQNYYNTSSSQQIVLFGVLFIFALGILEEYFWRSKENCLNNFIIDFLIKSLPTNIPMTMLIGVHYVFMIFLIMLLLFEWQYAILCCLIAFLWHMGMVYVRKLFKFSSVLVYGISARLAIFSCYYILFMNIKWV